MIKLKRKSSYLLSPSPPLWPSFRTCFLAVPSRAITQRLWAIAPSSVKWGEGSPSAKEVMCAKAQDVYGGQEAKGAPENGPRAPFPPVSFSVCFLISAQMERATIPLVAQDPAPVHQLCPHIPTPLGKPPGPQGFQSGEKAQGRKRAEE